MRTSVNAGLPEFAERARGQAIDLRSRVSEKSLREIDLQRFRQLILSLRVDLSMSDAELAKYAGTTARGLFALRTGANSKQPAVLRALDGIIALLDAHLAEPLKARRSSDARPFVVSLVSQRILADRAALFSLATSLALIARGEVQRLKSERANHPATAVRIRKQLELLEILAGGFERIAVALEALSADRTKPASVLLGRASEVVTAFGKEVNEWWKNNKAEAMDWGMRLPVVTAGVAMLGWAGANMTIATTGVFALVTGKKAISAFRKNKRK